MSKVIPFELSSKYFQKDKDQKFWVRLAKFDLKEGDTIRFFEIDDRGQRTGRFYDKKVTHFRHSHETVRHWNWNDLVKYGIYLIELSS
jgi:hypothetical protein